MDLVVAIVSVVTRLVHVSSTTTVFLLKYLTMTNTLEEENA